ncbi:MAG: hypothetical protein LAT80_02895 [Balneolaceae bacterium]|nr:hypothetical protein [Balneolaceae bacterium]
MDKDSLRAGEIFEYTIVVQGNYSGLTYPNEGDFDEDFEMLSRHRFQTAANQDSLVFRLQFFGTEDVILPAKEVTLHRNDSDTTLTTSRVPLFFKTVLAGDDEEFRPLKPIFDFARNVWAWIVALLLLALATWFIYRKWFAGKEPKRAPVAPPKTPQPFFDPLEELKREIAALPAAESLNGIDEYEQYYIRLGDAIRRYLKRVYRFPALEMTTREITMEMQSELVKNDVIRITRSVLNEADMVKFANFRPETEQAREALEKADRFIESAEATDRDRIDSLRKEHEEKELERVAKENRDELIPETEETEEVKSD